MLSILRKARLKDKELRILMLYVVVLAKYHLEIFFLGKDEEKE
jgi:hypothetical protein